ncbi:MAG: TRAP transporter large permease subunit, partial [Spirochaetales bacterium]|nr:TRAP transporter large permease subunit [Spirochaetales bacterium]
YKKLKWKHIPIIIKETVISTGSVMLIIASAKVFGYYMNCERLPQIITQALVSMTQSKYLLLFVINLMLLFICMFIEGGAALVILAPLLVPAVCSFGIDPLHFGVIFIVNIMIGGLTPPFGSMMFTVCSIVDCKFQDFVKQIWPFIVALLIVLFAVTMSEDIALAIPKLFGYIPNHNFIIMG